MNLQFSGEMSKYIFSVLASGEAKSPITKESSTNAGVYSGRE
jgi:hypothetical protein